MSNQARFSFSADSSIRFLKLLNLFSQGLMDKAVLYDKVRNFIGGNRELLEWFKRFIQWDSLADEIQNLPSQPTSKVRLSVCRSLGPSYRLLPKLVGFRSSFFFLTFLFYLFFSTFYFYFILLSLPSFPFPSFPSSLPSLLNSQCVCRLLLPLLIYIFNCAGGAEAMLRKR